MSSLFLENLQQHISLFSNLDSLNEPVARAAAIITDSLRNGGKLLLCGNGGSAADCQHIAAEFTGRFIKDRPPISAISLTTDTSALTCIGNDYSFDEIFSRQVSALGRPGDILLGISTSGNLGFVKATDESWDDVGIFWVVVVARAIEVCGHDAAVVHPVAGAVLAVVAFAELDAGDFGDGVGLVGGFQRPGKQGIFAHGLICQLGVDTA